MPIQPFETRRVVVLSTAHLSAQTCQMLNATPLEAWPVSGGRIAYGYYIWAPEAGDRELEAAPELQHALNWARNHGFDYVQFDADAYAREDLPTFEHE